MPTLPWKSMRWAFRGGWVVSVDRVGISPLRRLFLFSPYFSLLPVEIVYVHWHFVSSSVKSWVVLIVGVCTRAEQYSEARLWYAFGRASRMISGLCRWGYVLKRLLGADLLFYLKSSRRLGRGKHLVVS